MAAECAFERHAADVGPTTLHGTDPDIALPSEEQFNGIVRRTFKMRFETEPAILPWRNRLSAHGQNRCVRPGIALFCHAPICNTAFAARDSCAQSAGFLQEEFIQLESTQAES